MKKKIMGNKIERLILELQAVRHFCWGISICLAQSMRSQWAPFWTPQSLSWWPQCDTGEKCRMWVCLWVGGDYSIPPTVWVMTHSYAIMHTGRNMGTYTVVLNMHGQYLTPYESLANLTHTWRSYTVSFLKLNLPVCTTCRWDVKGTK